jgi:DNA-binding LytR/AlgR family response regulator
MSKIKILVVEDEVIIADNLCDILDGLGYETLDPVISYNEAVETISNNNVDIAILDIQLSGRKSGIDLAKTLNEDFNLPFIFLTSNSDGLTLNEAKKTNPSAFLVKPFSKEDLYPAIEVAMYNFAKLHQQDIEGNVIINNAIFFKGKGVFKKILFEDILYIKSDHIYVEIYLKNDTCQVVRISLTDILEKLSTSFIRVHRGYIVNVNEILEIDAKLIKVKNNIIPIGKTYKAGVVGRINLI